MSPAVRRWCLLSVVLGSVFQAVYLPLAVRRPTQVPTVREVASSPPSTSPEPAGGSRLEATPLRYDFGLVNRAEQVRYRFSVTNRGSGPAQVVRVWSTCGCTASNLGKDRLEPGESTDLEVSFTGRDPGPFRKSVFVVLSYPDPALKIDVSGTVRP